MSNIEYISVFYSAQKVIEAYELCYIIRHATLNST